MVVVVVVVEGEEMFVDPPTSKWEDGKVNPWKLLYRAFSSSNSCFGLPSVGVFKKSEMSNLGLPRLLNTRLSKEDFS